MLNSAGLASSNCPLRLSNLGMDDMGMPEQAVNNAQTIARTDDEVSSRLTAAGLGKRHLGVRRFGCMV